MGPRQPSGDVVVHFQGHQVAVLRPGDPVFTLGRGANRSLRFGHDNVDGGPDLDISRNVASIRYGGGLWVVCNDSRKRPFDVIVRGVPNPLHPQITPDSHARWAVSPPGLDIRICSPCRRYLISVRIDDPWPPAVDSPEHGDPSTNRLRGPTDHERLLLAAKFLATPDPGESVGNQEAAEYASKVRSHEEPVTAKAVEDCVGRWCKKLQELGVTGIHGRDNVNQLGRQLLAWGILRQEDRTRLQPRPLTGDST